MFQAVFFGWLLFFVIIFYIFCILRKLWIVLLFKRKYKYSFILIAKLQRWAPQIIL